MASAGDARGKQAVRAPIDRKLQAGFAGAQMDKMMNLTKLGMDQKRMEHEVKMGEGRLGLKAGMLKLGMKKADWNLKMESKATNIAKFGVAMNLAFGLTGFMAKRKKIQWVDNMLMKLDLMGDDVDDLQQKLDLLTG